MTYAVNLARLHRFSLSDSPFPWRGECSCGWRSRRCGSQRDAADAISQHLIQTGMDAA